MLVGVVAPMIARLTMSCRMAPTFSQGDNAELVSFEAAVQARVHKLRCLDERCTFNILSGDNTQHKASTPV